MNTLIQSIRSLFPHSLIGQQLLFFAVVLLLSYLLHKLLQKIILSISKKFIARFTEKTKNTFDDYIFKYLQFRYLAFFAYVAGCNVLAANMAYGASAFRKAASLFVIFIIAKLLHGFLDGLAAYTDSEPRFQGKPYRSYIQLIILAVYIAAAIIAAGTVSGKSPWALLSGIGAMTAVLLLVFRETILSFVTSVQISSYDLVRKGDWISVPRYDADGDVIEVALHTIKIQNWDKTISVVPTHDLLQSGFKNWRGMQETGGRRIKRPIFLDVSSIKFMDKDLRERVGQIKLLQPYF